MHDPDSMPAGAKPPHAIPGMGDGPRGTAAVMVPWGNAAPRQIQGQCWQAGQAEAHGQADAHDVSQPEGRTHNDNGDELSTIIPTATSKTVRRVRFAE